MRCDNERSRQALHLEPMDRLTCSRRNFRRGFLVRTRAFAKPCGICLNPLNLKRSFTGRRSKMALRSVRPSPIRKPCCLHSRPPGKLEMVHRADGDPARSFIGLFAGHCRSGAGDRRRREQGVRLHDQGQFRRGHHQQAPPFSASAIAALGGRAGVNRGPVQAFRRYQFHQSRSVDRGSGRVSGNCVKLWARAGARSRRHRATDGMLHHRQLTTAFDVPVFHDDQHGTAIIAAAGLIDALELTGRKIPTTKLVCNAAGAALPVSNCFAPSAFAPKISFSAIPKVSFTKAARA